MKKSLIGTCLLALAVSSCTPEVVTVVITLEGEPGYCPSAAFYYLGAWLDRNENGRREPDEPCLRGVAFKAEWYPYLDDRNTLWEETALTDGTGNADILTRGCGCGQAQIDLVVPTGYRPTWVSHEAIEDRRTTYYGLARVPGTQSDTGVAEVRCSDEVDESATPATPQIQAYSEPPTIIDHPIPELEIPSLDVFEDAAGTVCVRGACACESDSLLGELGCEEIWRPSSLLGGLEPSYPIAVCEWLDPSGISYGTAPVIFRDGGVELITSREQLRDVYAPIESETEALSYALVAADDLYARSVFHDASDFYSEYESYFSTFSAKYLLYYVEVLEDTHVVEIENGYEVYLFERNWIEECGSHPLYSRVVIVRADGQVSWRKIKLLELSPENEICAGVLF